MLGSCGGFSIELHLQSIQGVDLISKPLNEESAIFSKAEEVIEFPQGLGERKSSDCICFLFHSGEAELIDDMSQELNRVVADIAFGGGECHASLDKVAEHCVQMLDVLLEGLQKNDYIVDVTACICLVAVELLVHIALHVRRGNGATLQKDVVYI